MMASRTDAHDLWANAPIGLGLATRQGDVLAANAHLAHLLGLATADDLVGMSLAAFTDFPELSADVIGERLEEDRLDGLELAIRRQDGSEAVVRIHGHEYPLPGGEMGVSFSAEDVTIKHAEHQLSSRGHKMEAVVRFAAGIAHDYNNLLTTIIGEARDLLSDDPASEEGAVQILEAARRASDITRRLLVFSRSEVARNEIVSLEDAVAGVADTLAKESGPDIEIVLRLDEEPGRIKIDPAHLHQVITNLARNGMEAMPAGGRLVFETSRVVAPAETQGMDFDPPVPPGTYVSLAVGDSGIGMNQETRGRAFDPFFTTKPIGGGAGLGLTSVYGHVTRAEGHVFILSAPAHGTVVRLLFPMTDAPIPTTASEDEPDDTVHSSEHTVLVVDDEASVLRVMSRILKRAGYSVLKAEDGFAAKNVVRGYTGRIDLLVTDVMMPRMLGTELAEWVTKARPETAVILVSGYTDSPTVQEWVDRDPHVFLPKPFEPEEFIQAVRKRLVSVGTAPGAR